MRCCKSAPWRDSEPCRRQPSLSTVCVAEREGFEPSIEFLTLYSLSRGAPSASRAPLRIYIDHNFDSLPIPFRGAFSARHPCLALSRLSPTSTLSRGAPSASRAPLRAKSFWRAKDNGSSTLGKARMRFLPPLDQLDSGDCEGSVPA